MRTVGELSMVFLINNSKRFSQSTTFKSNRKVFTTQWRIKGGHGAMPPQWLEALPGSSLFTLLLGRFCRNYKQLFSSHNICIMSFQFSLIMHVWV